jgi:hypothetical protein
MSEVTQRKKEILGFEDQLRTEIEMLEGNLDTLTESLTDVLREESGATGRGDEAECLTPLGERLQNLVSRVRMGNERISNIIDRLEV